MRPRVALARLGGLARALAGRSHPVILMYHRVAATAVDPWGLSVAPATFERQMAYLARTRRPVHLDWLAAELRAGRRPRRAVAVTFDDAYRDVLQNAWPVLVRHQVPATVFVVSGAIGSEDGYWWDELAELVLGRPVLPTTLPLEAPEAEAARARGDREGLHLALWQALRLLDPARRAEALRSLAGAYGDPPIPRAPVMTEAELQAIREGGLVRLGVHSVTHPSLPSLPKEAQRAEMAQSRREVERIAGRPAPSLAYPFGDHDATTIRVARELGFDHAVGVEAGPARDWRQRFSLPRVDVKNWTDRQFAQALAWHG